MRENKFKTRRTLFEAAVLSSSVRFLLPPRMSMPRCTEILVRSFFALPDVLARRSPISNVSTTVVDIDSFESRGASPIPGGVDSDKKPLVKGSTFETVEGTLHVKPFRKKGSKSLKAVLTFVPRSSAFDRENVASGADPFRGFFTLFWISVSLVAICCAVRR
jgi:hypothetical protein